MFHEMYFRRCFAPHWKKKVCGRGEIFLTAGENYADYTPMQLTETEGY